jgi:transketolase
VGAVSDADAREALAAAMRRVVVEQSKRANVGHIGSCLSIVDIVATLFSAVLRRGEDDPDRDRFVLSKGHAALTLYAALHLTGRLDAAQLETFCGDGTALATHPDSAVGGVDFSSGSLGHGLSFGAGAALAAQLDGSGRRVFVLLSDAECNEGSVWEAVMFAAHHRLGNLVAIVDLNGQQAFGYTDDVLSLAPLADRWRAFGWDVLEVDGHDVAALGGALGATGGAEGLPRVVIARTVFGKGVGFMESRIEWHYWPLSDEQHRQALAEVAGAPAG